MTIEQRITELEQRVAELEKKAAAATTAEITNSNGCTECGRAWNSYLRYCGVCGNRLVPVSQLEKFFPQRKFTRVN
jgi:hypothetical protein